MPPEDSKLQRFRKTRVAAGEEIAIDGLIRTSSATKPPLLPKAEFGAVSLLPFTVVQGSPRPATALVQVPGRSGTVTPSKRSANRGPQASPAVQAFPSSQPLVFPVWKHPEAGWHPSSVQGFPSLQEGVTSVWTQPVAGLHESVVQRLLSLQAAVLSVDSQAPVAGLQASVVQRSASGGHDVGF